MILAAPNANKLCFPFRRAQFNTAVLSVASYHLSPRLAPAFYSTQASWKINSKDNAWAGKARAKSLDLRSDVTTIPTQSMLAAIQSCTHQDDVYQEDSITSNLESNVAHLVGKEAGLFVLSGTMGNQLSLRSLLTQPPYGVLCDRRSHILNNEAGAISSLTGAQVQPVTASNGIHLTLEDVKKEVVLGDDIHSCPTRVISLENTLNGMIMPLSEIESISSFAREHGISMHCDGTRLWEAAAAGAGAINELCAPFDTVNLCFTKGLGAPVGEAMSAQYKEQSIEA
ncbi:uncharacterized protein E0L32_011049 [Thyridium curvatum]|uniref:Aromatic amino acid beta-eliminating lyase/threonine aldolase domain-containing protein n=1 Tax=Thyridium curvatum TaxID=1093900 RepID=A0A507AQD2_9PEZI|nr:uncharacterized protein E0L32_011049 [Thyridium curvatum]TPX07061.1 hypothetical protein E0L32_011049 [Thyridium curvatum]